MPVLDTTTKPATGRIDLQCHGTRIAIRSRNARILERVLGNLPPGAAIAERGRPDVLYRVVESTSGLDADCIVLATRHDPDEGGRIARVSDEESAADSLLQDIEFRIALHAPTRVFIHAAAVEWLGRTIVLPGTSHCGKSTLTLALLRSGARYLSDEFTILDEDGHVLAFPRPLQLREDQGIRRISATQVATSGTAALPMGLVVRTWYESSATWAPQALGAGRTALALLENAVIARTRPQLALSRIARALADGATGLIGPRGDADETAQAILAWAAREWRACDCA